MLSLVRDTYPVSDQFDDLLTPGRYRTRHQVEDHLLDQIVPIAYTARPGQPVPRCTFDQAQGWLSYIAEQMTTRHTRDLAWWQIPTWQSRTFRVTVTFCAVSLMVGLAFGTACWLVLSLVLGFRAVLAGLVAGLVVGLRSGQAREPQEWTGLRWATLLSPAPIVAWLKDGLKFGPLIGFVYGVTTWDVLVIWRAADPTASLVPGLAVGLVGGLVGGVLSGLPVLSYVAAVRTATDPLDPADPLTCWRRDQRVNIVGGVTWGLSTALPFGLLAGLLVWILVGPLAGIVTGLVFWLAWCVMLALASSHDAATWSAALTFVQICRAGHGPLRMMRFLEDARSRHVLRTAGPVYQFRHARLQDRLAAARTTTAVTSAAPSPPSRTP